MALLLLGLMLAFPAGRPLAQADFASGLGDFRLSAGAFEVADGWAVGSAGELATTRPCSGDLAVGVEFTAVAGGELAVRFGAGPVECRWHPGAPGRVELRRAGEKVAEAPLPPVPDGPVSLTLMNRGAAIEVLAGDRSLLAHVGKDPVGGGPVRVAVAGGEFRIGRIRVERLPWHDGVEFAGDTCARAEELAGEPLERFSLLEPWPARVDPEFRVAVSGQQEPLVVRLCGVRRAADEVPLLEQALAYLRIRPYLRVLVLQGEDETPVPGEGEFGPFTVSGPKVVVEADALLGIVGDWPALTLWNGERILDRTLPGGPAGRPARAEIPDDVDRVRVTLSCPGRDTVEQEVVLNRSR